MDVTALQRDSPENPPSYEDASDEVWPPTILVLAGTSIHAESADSAPLYQINRAVASLTSATREVEFERVERTVKTTGGEPVVKPRMRHIYNLKYTKDSPGGLESLPSDSPHYYIQSLSRRTVGNVGLKKARLRTRWTALPIEISGKHSSYGFPRYVDGARSIFEMTRRKGRYEWTDGDGKAVAVEDVGEDQHRLIVTASLRRDYMDALVALWCCRVWQYSIEHTERVHEGLDSGMWDILSLPNTDYD
jgi:hypothetical protein